MKDDTNIMDEKIPPKDHRELHRKRSNEEETDDISKARPLTADHVILWRAGNGKNYNGEITCKSNVM